VWSWHPLLMLNWRRYVGPTGLRQAISADDGDKNEFVAGEEHEINRLKPLRRECRVFRGYLW